MRNKYTKELLEPIVAKSKTWAEVCRTFNVKPATGAQSYVKSVCVGFGIAFKHFVGNGFNIGRKFPKSYVDLTKVLVAGRPTNSNKLKHWLWRAGLKEKRCEQCNLTEWLGKPAPLELDHINRDHNDNRLENLQILCPNCHSLKGTKQKGV